MLIWFALIVAFCFWFLYNKTRHGKYMYAIGGNEAAAEVAGVNVNATKIRIYILVSCMFGLAGCLLVAKSGGASVNTAQLASWTPSQPAPSAVFPPPAASAPCPAFWSAFSSLS